MQVNLKQPEIEVALKNYIAQQGISLYGKAVSVTFTAGRKESGISAEITIDDLDIPGFGDEEDVTQAPVQEAKVMTLAPAIAAEVVEATASEATVEVVTETQEDGTTKSPSLFG